MVNIENTFEIVEGDSPVTNDRAFTLHSDQSALRAALSRLRACEHPKGLVFTSLL
jgi:hypothetical protein